jgi:hypothetical protein
MKNYLIMYLVFMVLLSVLTGCASAGSTIDPLLPYKYTGDMPLMVESWAVAKHKVLSDPAWKRWVDSEFKKLRRWQARGGDRAEWVTGDPHEYLDPITRGALRWSEDTPPPSQGLPGTAEANRFGGWVYYFRSNNISYVLIAARLYQLTGDIEALNWARSQLNLYAGQYMQWPLQRLLGESRLMGQSLDEATALTELVPAIRLIAPAMPQQELVVWKQNLVQPMVDGLLRSFHGLNNIGVWQRSAVACAALLLDDDALWRETVWGPQGVAALLRRGITKDGQWNEGTFGYSEYVVRALLPLLYEGAVAGRLDELEPIRYMAHDLLVAPISLRFPDGTLPNPGDNRGLPKAFNRSLLLDSTHLLPTPAGVAEWRTSKGWPQLVADWYPSATSSASLPYESRRMDATGFAMLRHQGWHLFLHFGQASRNHAQYEALSFELQHDLGRIVTDLGTTAYGSPLHMNYFTRAAAHNVPMVNDHGQNNFALGQLTGFEPEQGRMVAKQLKYRPGVTVTRELALNAQSLFDEINVIPQKSAPAISTLGAILHLDCDLVLPQLQRAPIPGLPTETGFGYWQQLATYRLPARFEFNAICGTVAMQVQIDGPAEGIMLIGHPPVLDKRNRQAIYVRYPVSQGKIQTTYTLLEPGQERPVGVE